MRWLWLTVLAFALCGGATAATAKTWRAGGLSFSDELGGFRLVSVSGSGSALDPIVIVEEITDIRPAILVIRNLQKQGATGAALPSPPYIAATIIAIVINRSGRVWGGFDLELREALDAPSPFTDGLSFDQMRTFDRPVRSDSFATGDRINEPYDRIRFHGGSVDPDATARFSFHITDPSITSEFYLLQEPLLLLTQRTPDGMRSITRVTWAQSRWARDAPRRQ